MKKLIQFVLRHDSNKKVALKLSAIPTLTMSITWNLIELIQYGRIIPNLWHDLVALICWIVGYLVMKMLLDIERERKNEYTNKIG